MYKQFPDTIGDCDKKGSLKWSFVCENFIFFPATFPFLPAGISFGYLFFLPLIDTSLHDLVSFWPYFAMLFSIVITASAISIIKLNNGKYIFEHFTYLMAASVLYIIAGILFVLRQDKGEFSLRYLSYFKSSSRAIVNQKIIFARTTRSALQ